MVTCECRPFFFYPGFGLTRFPPLYEPIIIVLIDRGSICHGDCRKTEWKWSNLCTWLADNAACSTSWVADVWKSAVLEIGNANENVCRGNCQFWHDVKCLSCQTHTHTQLHGQKELLSYTAKSQPLLSDGKKIKRTKIVLPNRSINFRSATRVYDGFVSG